MEETDPQGVGLAEALAVIEGRLAPRLAEEDAKLLHFFLREGECTAIISESTIAVRYSWVKGFRPSEYFIRLAPGLVGRLMQLGNVKQIVDEATFSVGPTTTGTGRYVFAFNKKWIRIRRESEQIAIRVRDERERLGDESLNSYGEVVRCERCSQELRTPLAKQCFHCGYDWH